MRLAAFAIALLSLADATSSNAATRRAFITSTAGNGNLSGWADAGGETGVAAGDAICQAHAAALEPPGTFRAWLSSSTDDAYCRIHGLGGKRASNCGQAELPVAAGPWVRTDGLPFGEEISTLLPPTGAIYYPLRFDEDGALSAATSRVWTATDSDGSSESPNCDDWSSSSDAVFSRVGSGDFGTNGWTSTGQSPCNLERPLFCFESGVGDPLPARAGWGRLAFVTTGNGNGNLGGWDGADGQTALAAGDAVCQSEAGAADLPYPESFKAWLSDGATDARDRFDHDGPWMRLDRVLIASGLSDLTDSKLVSAPNQTAAGAYLGSAFAWTGTLPDGTAALEICGGWIVGDGTAFGRRGNSSGADTAWTQSGQHACGNANRLYCLQDLPLVFGDGFESGSSVVWTTTAP